MSADDEKVLAFPAVAKRNMVGLPGVVTHQSYPLNIDTFLNDVGPKLRFMPRWDIEYDPANQQVIPYTYFQTPEGRILVYNRGKKGGEKRLASSWSVGVGGHMNDGDVPEHLRCGDLQIPPWGWLQVLRRAIRRELEEEISGFEFNESALAFRGFIDIADSPVDAVHFGLVFRYTCSDPSVIKPTDEVTSIRWVTLEDLMNYDLENWSLKVREVFI